MDATLRDLAPVWDSFTRNAHSAFDKLADLQILDITFAEWLILGSVGLMWLWLISVLIKEAKELWRSKGKRTR